MENRNLLFKIVGKAVLCGLFALALVRIALF